MLLQSFVICDI